jgi:two-component system sensor histidine kinase YesM
MADSVQFYSDLSDLLNVVIGEVRYTTLYTYNAPVNVVFYPFSPNLRMDNDSVRDIATIRSADWYQALRESGTTLWRAPFREGGTEYISINRIMKDFDTLRDIAVLSVYFPADVIDSIISPGEEDLPTLLIHTGADWLADYEASAPLAFPLSDLDRSLSDDWEDHGYERVGDFLVGTARSQITGWRIVGLYPYRSIINRVAPIRTSTAAIILVGLVMAVLIQIGVSRMIMRRLHAITDKIVRVKADRYTPIPAPVGNDEISNLDRSFNEMVLDLNHSIEREQQLEWQKNSLTMELVQAQINPHILYNTLSAIEYWAKRGRSEEIADVTRRLILFFKYFLHKGDIATSIRDEIAMIQQYEKIMLFTYNLECDVEYQIDPEVLQYSSLKLFLQPIVENAITHGVKPLLNKKRGRISIHAELKDRTILFTVSDNGVGFEESRIDDIFGQRSTVGKSSFGLRNVLERIHLYFGTEFGVWLKSTPGSGTETSVLIPALTDGELHDRLHSSSQRQGT